MQPGEFFFKVKYKKGVEMKKVTFKHVKKLIAILILLFFVVSGNGKFNWDKIGSKLN
jgi:hypothetical protein